jgi:hypothetical protein
MGKGCEGDDTHVEASSEAQEKARTVNMAGFQHNNILKQTHDLYLYLDGHKLWSGRNSAA